MTTAETVLEAAGRRLSTYLRALPIPETRRHELALRTLRRLTMELPLTADEAQARAMELVQEAMERHVILPEVHPGPKLVRRHMRPEPMDRRPWIRFVQRHGTPVYVVATWLFHSAWADAVFLAIITIILHALGRAPTP